MEALTNFIKREAAEALAKRDLAEKDENVGSARATNSTISGFVSTLAVNLIVFVVFILIFVILRRSNRRIYAPRTYVGVVERWRRLNVQDGDGDGYADEVEGVTGFSGLLGWISSVWKIPDETVLRSNGLDGYFFLRYLRKAQLTLFIGCCMVWPLLFPINATGGNGQKGLDMLSYSNVSDDNKNRLYAHVFIAWIFYAFVLFTIYREMVFFTSLRQAYMLSPIYATRISARTLLVTTVPDNYLNESALRRIFDNVKRIWICTDTDELDELVAEREKVTLQLEAAEVKLIKLADKARRKAGGQEAAQDDDDGEVEGESGSVAARWLPRKDRPTHRLKPLIGEKVDTIDWCRTKLAELNPKIVELQESHRSGERQKLNSVFIEFDTQSAAQVALQTLAHNKPLHMAPRYIGVTPEEVIWTNMKLQWWERLSKFATTTAFTIAMVIFWSIPVAVVGLISNINYLTEKVPFLRWIDDVPPVVLGVITGLLPVVMLAILMSLVPIILRLMARISGCPSLSTIELRTQNSYFLFQVIQVFLVTTMTSAASSAVPQIIKEPAKATSLLAENLPKASNFYISFMILQGLSVSAGALVQLVGLVLYKLLGLILDNTPRKMYNRWSSLSGLGWGTVFPVYTNILVIALTYAVIAPLVMGFAVLGFGLLYFAYRYNLLFVYNVSINTSGLVYPRALYQTMTGIYLGEICMIGLFAIKKAPGPLVLMIVFLVVTVLYQITLQNAIQPLLQYLPKNLEKEEESLLSLETGKPGEGTTHSAHEVTDEKTPGSETEAKPGVIARFLRPEQYESYSEVRKRLPKEYPEIIYEPEEEQNAYYNPSIRAEETAIWIPRDVGGVSAQEIAHTSAVHPISDVGAYVNEKGSIVREEEAFPPGYRGTPLW